MTASIIFLVERNKTNDPCHFPVWCKQSGSGTKMRSLVLANYLINGHGSFEAVLLSDPWMIIVVILCCLVVTLCFTIGAMVLLGRRRFSQKHNLHPVALLVLGLVYL